MSVKPQPTDGSKPAPKPDGVSRLYYGQGEFQFGDLRLPDNTDGPFPVVILIHGGFWKARYALDLMHSLAEDLAQRGVATWNIEYRRVKYEDKPGNPGGGWPGTFLDVANAADYLRTIADQYKLDLKKVVAIGHSAGGHLALWLVARHKLPKDSPLSTTTEPLQLAGTISLAGANDLKLMWEVRKEDSPVANFLDGTPAEQPERYRLGSPREWLPLGVPQILVHGDQDINVPIELSRSYYVAAQAAGDNIKFIELPGVEHFALINPQSQAWAKTVEALQNLI